MNGERVLDPVVRSEIEALIAEHAWLLDNHQSERLHECYTEEGLLHGIGKPRHGREALRDYGTNRSAMQREARHVAGIPRLLWNGPEEIQGTLTIILFRHDGAEMGVADPVAVADAHDVYRKVDGRWLIHERRLALVFESEAHRA
jgi:hypothetical protein